MPHIQWAIKNQNPVRKWYLQTSSFHKGWFEKGLYASYSSRQYVSAIYSLEISEEEKIKLLHQYHKELNALQLKVEEHLKSMKSIPITEPFYKEWEQKLDTIKNEIQ